MLADLPLIGVDDPLRADVLELLAEHLADMRATSPPESVHALDAAALAVSTVTFFTARVEGAVWGCGALSDLGGGQGEIKSMRTTPSARNRGVASMLLTRLLDEARDRGYAAVSLETGAQDYFAPARAMYTKFGFTPCAPFAAYTEDPNSVYLRLSLK